VSPPLLWLKVVELQHESKIDWDFYMRNVMPVGASQAATLALGNAVYMYLTVSFIQVRPTFLPQYDVMRPIVSKTSDDI
jgi:hypothetical protein